MRKKSLILLSLKLLKFPITILSFFLIAKFFGVSYQKDVWLIAFATITTIDLAIWGAVNDVFRSKFIQIRETESESIALEKTQSLLFFMLLISALVVLIVMIFAPFISNVVAENFTGEKQKLLIFMLRVLAPILLVNQISLISTSILNAFNSFYAPEISSFCSQIINIALIFVLAPSLGIYSLVISAFVSVIILCIILIYFFRKNKIKIISRFKPRFKDFLIFFLFALPLFSSYCLSQVGGVIEKRLLSGLEIGAVSVLDFSKKFPDIFNGLLMSVILTVLVPALSSSYYKKDPVQFNKDFLESYRMVILGLGIYFSVMLVGSESFLNLFYGASPIDKNSLDQIVYLNILYSLSLFGIFTYIIFGLVLISIGKNKMNALIGSTTQILMVLINIVLVRKFGIQIFPISMFISHLLTGVIMAYFYPFSKKEIIQVSFKYYSFLLISTLSVFFSYFIFRKFILSDASNYVNMTIIIILNISAFVLMAFIFKLEELNKILEVLKKTKNKIVKL